jgi:hypothetical protein
MRNVMNILPEHRETYYTVYYESPNIAPDGWWPVSQLDKRDPSLAQRKDIDRQQALECAYTFDRRTAFEELRKLRDESGLVSVAVKKYRYYAAGKPGPDGKPMKIGQSRQVHCNRFFTEVANG